MQFMPEEPESAPEQHDVEERQGFWQNLPLYDLTDQSQWSEPIDDPDEFFKAVFGA